MRGERFCFPFRGQFSRLSCFYSEAKRRVFGFASVCRAAPKSYVFAAVLRPSAGQKTIIKSPLRRQDFGKKSTLKKPISQPLILRTRKRRPAQNRTRQGMGDDRPKSYKSVLRPIFSLYHKRTKKSIEIRTNV